jgi:hypothetical protein
MGHGLGTFATPDHAALLQSCADDPLTGTFHRTAADVISSGPEFGITHLVLVFVEVANLLHHSLSDLSRSFTRRLPEADQHLVRPFALHTWNAPIFLHQFSAVDNSDELCYTLTRTTG